MDQFSRREVMKAYHRNPVVKLPSYDWPGASVAAAITDALAERYEEVKLPSELGDLGRFADVCFKHDVEVWRIAKVVADELRRGNSPGDYALQGFLDDRPSAELTVELAASLLNQLNSIHEDLGTWPSRDILYAVSASLSRRFEQSAPTDGQRHYLCVAVAGVVYRLNIMRLAEWTDHSAAGPDECVAQLMRLCSHILGVDDHLDMRILESLPAMLARFTYLAGTTKDDLRGAWSAINHMYSDSERRVGSVTLQALTEVEQQVDRLAPIEVHQ